MRSIDQLLHLLRGAPGLLGVRGRQRHRACGVALLLPLMNREDQNQNDKSGHQVDALGSRQLFGQAQHPPQGLAEHHRGAGDEPGNEQPVPAVENPHPFPS
jgi:hypothetical protein